MKKRIAVLRLCGLGDAVQLTPLLQQIRADEPSSSIELFINEAAVPVIEGSPLVDRIHALPLGVMTESASNFLLWRMWAQVRSQGRFDTFLHLDLRWRRSALYPLVSAARAGSFTTIGRKPWKASRHTVTVPVDFASNSDHTSLWNLRLWQAVTGYKNRGFGYDVRHLAGTSTPIAKRVALAPGAGNPMTDGALKRWPLENWVTLAKAFLDAGWTPVFLGSTQDMAGFSLPSGCVDQLGKLDVKGTARELGCSAGMIGNDSGLYQIALGMGIPSVGLFGCTSPMRTGPFRTQTGLALTSGMGCSPCYAPVCAVNIPGMSASERPYCMSGLRAQVVFQRSLQHFENTGRPAAAAQSDSQSFLR